MRQAMAGLGAAAAFAAALAAQNPAPGVTLGDLSWPEAEKVLTPSTVVVLPLGVATVQHGPHLKLNNNERLARYLTSRVQGTPAVVIAPPLAYHFYPTFLEYPGSTSISANTARDMTIDIVRSLAKYGPRRFYVLNTGVTTMFPLKDAAEALGDHGILLGYTDMRYRLANARVERQQTRMTGAAHADEVETSIMLFVDPSAVDMTRAVREYGSGSGPMTRQKDAPGTFSASGIVGDPTLATKEKGQAYVEALVTGVREDIEAIRTARLPVAKGTTPAPAPARVPPPRAGDEKMPNGCTAGEERAIRAVGERFSYLWAQMDPEALARMFTLDGDMRHPDGTIERGQSVLYQNRVELFRKREYRGSVHPVALNDMRCLPGGTAVADGKWELRFEDTPAPGPLGRGGARAKRHSGWCTLVLVRGESTWAIQAWRYTIDPDNGVPPPTTLKQPGFLGRGGGH